MSNQNNIPLYAVGERVSLLIDIDNSGTFYDGQIVALDSEGEDHFYQVEFDHNGSLRWLDEDQIDSIPTKEQLTQFSALVERVYDKLVRSGQ